MLKIHEKERPGPATCAGEAEGDGDMAEHAPPGPRGIIRTGNSAAPCLVTASELRYRKMRRRRKHDLPGNSEARSWSRDEGEIMKSFTIHASKDGEWVETQGTSPTLIVAKANSLHKTGWEVHITDSDGRRFGPSRFIDVLSFDRKPSIKF